MADQVSEKLLLSAIQMFASAIEELSQQDVDTCGAGYYAASGLQQVLRMVPRDDLLEDEQALLEVLERFSENEAVVDRL